MGVLPAFLDKSAWVVSTLQNNLLGYLGNHDWQQDESAPRRRDIGSIYRILRMRLVRRRFGEGCVHHLPRPGPERLRGPRQRPPNSRRSRLPGRTRLGLPVVAAWLAADSTHLAQHFLELADATVATFHALCSSASPQTELWLCKSCDVPFPQRLTRRKV